MSISMYGRQHTAVFPYARTYILETCDESVSDTRNFVSRNSLMARMRRIYDDQTLLTNLVITSTSAYAFSPTQSSRSSVQLQLLDESYREWD